MGEIDVEAFLRRYSYKTFKGWLHYFELEPWGDVRADYHAASVTQMLYNINRGKNQKARPLGDFLLKFDADDDAPKQMTTWQEQWRAMEAIAKAHMTEEQQAKFATIPPPRTVTGPVKWPSVIEEGTAH